MITERQKIYEYIEDAFDFARREGLPEDWDAVEFRRNAIKSYIDAAEAEIARLKEERDRIERNRDMWKGQCERQTEELQLLRTKDAG